MKAKNSRNASYLDLRASELVESLKSDLRKLVKPGQPDKEKGVHVIQVPKGEDPKQYIEAYEAEHRIESGDIVFIMNMTTPPPETGEVENDTKNPVVEDLSSHEEKPTLEEVAAPPEPESERPPRLQGRSWAEIELMRADGALTKQELKWLSRKGLPGSLMPPIVID